MKQIQKLKEQFRKYGYDYEQVKRTQYAAIYSQSSENKLVSFEVHKIKIKKEGIVFGRWQPLREVYPHSEDFGSIAWTVPTIERATEIMQKITAHEESKISPDRTAQENATAKSEAVLSLN